MVTKKDFRAIAEIIEHNTVSPVNPAYNDNVFKTSLAEDLADYFTTQNPKFNRQKFLNACGLGD